MKLIGAIFFLTLFFNSQAQTSIFIGDQAIPSNRVYEIKGNEVLKFTSGIFSDPLYYFEQGKIYNDRFRSKCLYTFQGDKVYLGESTSSFDLIYEIKGDKLLMKTGDIFEKVIYTITQDQIFIGDSKSPFDALFKIEFDQNFPEHKLILAVLIGPL